MSEKVQLTYLLEKKQKEKTDKYPNTEVLK